MADISHFSVTPTGAANVNVIDVAITARVVDSNTQEVIADYTDANTLHFPGVLTTLTAEQRQAIMDMVAMPIVLMKAGLQ